MHDRLSAIARLQFPENVLHMPFDGLDGEHQRLSNLLVRGSLRHQVEHLQFTFGKRVQQRLLRRLCSCVFLP